MNVSVIIPTYNRAEVLRKTLSAYAGQAGQHQLLELLVVDDGSGDQTASVVQECARLFPFAIRYLHQQNRGLAASRNHGLREARGDLVLFGDDDIIPSPRMVAEHFAAHEKHPEEGVGIFGHVAWDPVLRPTPFMTWAGTYGPLLPVGHFKPDMELDPSHALFGNTSVKSAFLRKHGVFDEGFSRYGWEDLELSYRLYQKGYRVRYSRDAVGYHHKFVTFRGAMRQIEALYASWPTFARTDAGRQFLKERRAQSAKAPKGMKSALKEILKSTKPAIMPLLRCLMDSRIPLPGRLYDAVLFHYLTPFADVVAANEKAGAGLDLQAEGGMRCSR